MTESDEARMDVVARLERLREQHKKPKMIMEEGDMEHVTAKAEKVENEEIDDTLKARLRELAAELRTREPEDKFTDFERELVLACKQQGEVRLRDLRDILLTPETQKKIDDAATRPDMKAIRRVNNAVRKPIKRGLLERSRPGFVAYVKPGHPSTLDQPMLELALYLHANRYREIRQF